MKILNFALATIMLTGCAILHPTWDKTAQDIIKSAKVKEDTFEKTKTVNFAKVTPYTLQDRKKVLGQWDTLNGQFYLRGIVIPKLPVVYQIVIATNNTSEWGFYERALDSDGKKLDFKNVDSKVDTSLQFVKTVEYMTITFDDQYLKKHINDNLIIKVYGKRDNFVFYVPQSYLEGVYKYFNETDSLQQGK